MGLHEPRGVHMDTAKRGGGYYIIVTQHCSQRKTLLMNLLCNDDGLWLIATYFTCFHNVSLRRNVFIDTYCDKTYHTSLCSKCFMITLFLLCDTKERLQNVLIDS